MERPKVGDRVRVTFEGEVTHIDEDSKDYAVRVVPAPDNPMVGVGTWVKVKDCTILPPDDTDEVILGAPPERSNTAIEERLRKLETQVGAFLAGENALRIRADKLEKQAQLQQGVLGRQVSHLQGVHNTLASFADGLANRVVAVERGVKSIRSAFNSLAEE